MSTAIHYWLKNVQSEYAYWETTVTSNPEHELKDAVHVIEYSAYEELHRFVYQGGVGAVITENEGLKAALRERHSEECKHIRERGKNGPDFCNCGINEIVSR